MSRPKRKCRHGTAWVYCLSCQRLAAASLFFIGAAAGFIAGLYVL